MNLNPQTQLGYREQPENTLDVFLTELTDRASIWYDLKVAEMPGCDYVFAPDASCRQLTSTRSIQLFLNRIQTILGSPKSRTTLMAYWHDRYRQLHFQKFEVNWEDGMVADVSRALLDGSPQLDYIKMIYEHSEPLICDK